MSSLLFVFLNRKIKTQLHRENYKLQSNVRSETVENEHNPQKTMVCVFIRLASRATRIQAHSGVLSILVKLLASQQKTD